MISTKLRLNYPFDENKKKCTCINEKKKKILTVRNNEVDE